MSREKLTKLRKDKRLTTYGENTFLGTGNLQWSQLKFDVNKDDCTVSGPGLMYSFDLSRNWKIKP